MRRLILFALFILLLPVACGEEEAATPAPTASVVQVATPVSTPTGALPTEPASPEPATEPVATEVTAPTTAPATTTAPTTVAPTATAAGSTSGLKAASRVELTLVADGFDEPTYVTHAGDERLFVVEQPGRIQIVLDGQRLPQPFLDIGDRVGSRASEQGLLSVAFHPRHAENGYFYVNYTDRNGDTVISRFRVTADANVGDPASEFVLLAVDQPFGNHNGGQLQFGPDGMLYVGMGDGGSAGDPENNGQDPDTLLGALLRLDVDGGNGAAYGIPIDNPYVGDDGGREEVWAIGLRNPWRFSFDRETGDLYVADVGQNQYEEINFVASGSEGGLNFGWNPMEANHCYLANCNPAAYTAPVAEYSHAGGNCSVTGGYAYRGNRYPELAGNYFFGDYCSRRIDALFRQPDGSWLRTEVGQAPGALTSFGEDASGELYLVTKEGGLYSLQLQ